MEWNRRSCAIASLVEWIAVPATAAAVPIRRHKVGACGVISEDVAPSGAHAVTGAHVTLTVTRGDDDAVMMM
ncbi:unnamed protein product [Lampetra planeri]